MTRRRLQNVRVFRSLNSNTRVLEFGRLRIWVRPALRPRFYCYHDRGVRCIGVGYLSFMLFDRPRRALTQSTGKL
jgi:hypothetical protein